METYYNDENAPPPSRKLLHSRFKSTSTLPSMAQAGEFSKPNPKRSAFGDLTGGFRGRGLSKDDSNIVRNAKKNAVVDQGKENQWVPYKEKEKASVKPDHKVPASVITKNYTALGSIPHQQTKQPLIENTSAIPRKKGPAKRSTVVYKDEVLPEQENGGEHPHIPSQSHTASSSHITQPPKPPRHFKSQPSLKKQTPTLRKTKSRILPTLVQDQSVIDVALLKSDVSGLRSLSILSEVPEVDSESAFIPPKHELLTIQEKPSKPAAEEIATRLGHEQSQPCHHTQQGGTEMSSNQYTLSSLSSHTPNVQLLAPAETLQPQIDGAQRSSLSDQEEWWASKLYTDFAPPSDDAYYDGSEAPVTSVEQQHAINQASPLLRDPTAVESWTIPELAEYVLGYKLSAERKAQVEVFLNDATRKRKAWLQNRDGDIIASLKGRDGLSVGVQAHVGQWLKDVDGGSNDDNVNYRYDEAFPYPDDYKFVQRHLKPLHDPRSAFELAAAKYFVELVTTDKEINDELADQSLVAEYAEDAFEHFKALEIQLEPERHYMDAQSEVTWESRAVLMDWLVQVHARLNLVPETLFLTVNIVDRFLSTKIVSLAKLQLVGATAIFIAAKYEELCAPSIGDIHFMVDGSYSKEDILKAERFMLNLLDFQVGWPGPMSFLRRVSKADDYDVETRTLAKYFLEVTIMDEAFVASPPSFLAAAAHCLARLMLRRGIWSAAHTCHSGYTYVQLLPAIAAIKRCCMNPRTHHAAVFDKYSDRRFKKAATFAEAELQKGFRVDSLDRAFMDTTTTEWYLNTTHRSAQHS